MRTLLAGSAIVLAIGAGILHAQDAAVLAQRAAKARITLDAAPALAVEKSAVVIQPPTPDWTIGRIVSVASDADGLAYVLHRGDRSDSVVVVDRGGRVVRSWGKGMFKIPHSIKVDAQGNVWTTDAGTSEVIKFSPEGKKLMSFVVEDLPPGKNCAYPAVPSNGNLDFCGTTDITFLPGGRIFITDGYGKMRVLEYSAAGRRVKAWGGEGDGPAGFRIPHGLAYDGQGVLFVADREAGRIQRFDPSGKYLGDWTHLGKAGSIAYLQGALWAAIRTGEPAAPNAVAPSWIVKIDPATGKILGKTAVDNSDFIDVRENGEIIAGAQARGFTRYRLTR